MNFFFRGCVTVESIKRQYRELAKQWHPDLGGDLETMKELNKQYHESLSKLHGAKTFKEGKEFTYYYNEPLETELTELIYRALGLKMADVSITLVGLWIWIEGSTMPHRDSLKGLGCKWHSKRGAWYFHSNKLRTRFNGSISLDGLKEVYGAEVQRGEGIRHIK